MAITFELYIETLSEQQMRDIESYWRGYSTHLRSEETIFWDLGRCGPTALSIYSGCSGSSGRGSYERAAQLSECGIDLAMHLIGAPDFLFARIGVQASTLTKEDYVADYKDAGAFDTPAGMILSESFWHDLGNPRPLTRFRDKYYWKRYDGEALYPVAIEEYLYALWARLPDDKCP